MIELLANNPLLLLFGVAAVGYPLGRIKVRGFGLGVAAVLFAGLAFGALDERLALPSFVYLFGLVLFVYTIGLAGGPSFFASFGRQGFKHNALALGVLLIGASLCALAHSLLDLSAPLTAGLFTGSLTNTPALAGVLDSLASAEAHVQALPVVAYAVAYPVGVVGVILIIQLFQTLFKTDYAAEARHLRDLGASGEHLENVTVRVTRPDVDTLSFAGWQAQENWQVILGRYRRAGQVALAHPHTVLKPGDDVTLVGSPEQLERAADFLGEVETDHLEFDRHELDFRRVFVSNPQVAEKTLAQLDLPKHYGALVTRVRRGDADHLPHADTRLELGDRVRVVARRERMGELSTFFGDSYKALSEVDIMTLALGIALGLLLGLVSVPLGGHVRFSLGLAGGPLIVALCLGGLGRTGSVVWQLPYSANLTLRQMGLILFLAGVGTRSGYAFVSTLAEGGGLALFLAGAAITLLTATLTLLIGHLVLKIPMSLLTGILAGLQTQPAVLGFANEQTGNDLANVGYASVFPLATISKILFAQLLLAYLP